MENHHGTTLSAYEIRHHENGIRYVTKNFVLANRYVIYVSCLMKQFDKLLQAILPILKENNIAFSIIKNKFLHYQLNSGIWGENEIGKVITLSFYELSEAEYFYHRFKNLANEFNGPTVADTYQIASILYLGKICSGNNNQPTLVIPPYILNKFPDYRAEQVEYRRRRIIGRYYIPVEKLSESAKSIVYKGINVKKFSFSWCLIKQGKPYMAEDDSGRNINDRLEWEMKILKKLNHSTEIPEVIDYLIEDNKHNLILSYCEGLPMHMVAENLRGDNSWPDLPESTRKCFLQYFQQIVSIVHHLHSIGIVHRDIKESNFIINLQTKKVSTIDFELSFDMNSQQPCKPFIMGTPGYVCPEQIQGRMPSIKEDIYSLGALLSYLISGILPLHLFKDSISSGLKTINILSGNDPLIYLIEDCLEESPELRPTTSQILELLEDTISAI